MHLAETSQDTSKIKHYDKLIGQNRGYNVYYPTQLMGVSGRTKDGKMVTGTYELPLFSLTIEDRIQIVKATSAVFGVITSRMNKISALEKEIIPKSKEEDRIAQKLKDLYSLYKEYSGSGDVKYIVASGMFLRELKNELVDLLPDASNFGRSLMRWKRKIKLSKQSEADEITEWIQRPNMQDDWETMVKKYVFDLLVHGAVSTFKEFNEDTKILDNFYLLPGGSVYPLRTEFVGGYDAYVQAMPTHQPKIYFADEIIFSNYVPTTAQAYGLIPIEALINKIAESLLFDEYMASRADGTKVPEKLVVMGRQSPFGKEGAEFATVEPLDPEEQKRVETKIAEKRKEAVVVLTGYGTPVVTDISKADTAGIQQERQKMIREEVALVFNMSNLEINMSSSEGVSGRATGESLETIEQNKGVLPIVNQLQRDLNTRILPYRFGTGYELKFKIGKNQMEDLQYNKLRKESGLYAVNEIREEDGRDPFDGEQFDKPSEGGGEPPDGSETSPLFTQQSA